MNDYKRLFGYAAILFGLGFFVRSFMPAYALNGPTISMGSNPIESHYGMNRLTAGNSTTIFTNSSTNDFIITKYLQNSENGCSLAIDGQSVFTNYDNGKRNVAEYANFSGTLVLPAGSVASSKNITPSSTHYCSYYLEGYYVH